MKDNYSNHNYNKNLQPFANQLRKEMTKAEACLWKYILKAKQLKGYQFRRQRPVLNYIADFICMELMLLIVPAGGGSSSIHKEISSGGGHTTTAYFHPDPIFKKAMYGFYIL